MTVGPTASQLDLIRACAASYATSQGHAETVGDYTPFGNAAHEVMRCHVNGERHSLEAIAEVYGLDSAEAARLDAVTAWAQDWLAAHPECHGRAEVQLVGGKVDLLAEAVAADLSYELQIVDWKFGVNPDQPLPENRLQLLRYAVIAWREYEARGTLVSRITVRAVYPSLRRADEPLTLSREDLERAAALTDALVARAVEQGNLPIERREYRPGDHCGWCAGRGVCPGRRAEVALASAALAVVDGKALAEAMPLDEIPRYRQRSKLIQDVIDDADKILKARVAEVGGKVAGHGLEVGVSSSVRKASPSASGILEWLRNNGHATVADEVEANYCAHLGVYPVVKWGTVKPVKDTVKDIKDKESEPCVSPSK